MVFINVVNKKINFDNVKILKGAQSQDSDSLTRISEMFYCTGEMITNVEKDRIETNLKFFLLIKTI